MTPSYKGRLELTWTNKHLALLAQDDGSYEWVDPSDYRVAEVRLLNDVSTVGKVSSKRASSNLLIRGDALNALTTLGRLPEFAAECLGKVKLAYIDPPFNTQQSFLHYDDALEHSVWLTMMRDRLLQIKDLLHSDGSVWVHLDDTEVHRARSMMDEVFGPDCYVTTIVWQKADSPRMDAKQFSSSNDFLLVYSREPGWQPNRFSQDQEDDDDMEDEPAQSGYPYVDEYDDNRRFKSAPLRKWGKNSNRKDRPNLWYPITAPTGDVVWPIKPDGSEGNWRWKREKVAAESHRLHWIDKGSGLQPYVKTYEDEDKKPRPPETWWPNDEVGHNRSAKAHIKQLFGRSQTFETPKPEQLLHRILFIATNAGDIVLDCFLGSGTTAAVAHKMNRRWVGVERSSDTLSRFALPRLTKVVNGEDRGGITNLEDWTGGGGFRVLEVAPSMFETDEGLVMLADWMTNGKLAEATAAQLGFVPENDPPFVGRKGRTRLVVLDGVVNEPVVRLIANALPEQERVVVCGTGVDPQARPVLRGLRPGSTLRKIPSALLEEYKLSRQLDLDLSVVEDSTNAIEVETKG